MLDNRNDRFEPGSQCTQEQGPTLQDGWSTALKVPDTAGPKLGQVTVTHCLLSHTPTSTGAQQQQRHVRSIGHVRSLQLTREHAYRGAGRKAG